MVISTESIYPEKWVLIEALDARTEGDKRIVEQMDVIGSFADDGDCDFFNSQIGIPASENKL